MLRTRVKGEPGRMMCSDAHADAQLSFYDLPPCLLTIVGALVADTTHVSDEDGSGAEELDTDHPDNSNALLPEVFDSSKGADHVAYQPLLQAFTYESPVNIFPELMEQPELMPFLLRPDQMSSCSALSCALEGASATVVSPTPSLSYNFTNQEKTDLQFLLVPPPSNQQDSHYPQGVNYDEFKWLVPNPLMTIEDAGSHKTGFFEGQKFLFVDEENLLAYESAVIRK